MDGRFDRCDFRSNLLGVFVGSIVHEVANKTENVKIKVRNCGLAHDRSAEESAGEEPS